MSTIFKTTADLAVRKTNGAFNISFVTSDMSNVLLDTGDATGIKSNLNFNHTFTLTPPFLINVVSDFSLITDISCINQSLTACDVSRFENLEYVNISNNLIDTFEVTQNIKLVDINISNNQIKNLDITNNVNLLYVNISNNLFLAEDINEIIIQLDEYGLSNGSLNYSNNIENPIGDTAAIAYNNLVNKGWIITGAKPQGSSLLLSINTTLTELGSSNANSVILPIQTLGVDSSFSVDWGDGTFDVYTYEMYAQNAPLPNHTYTETGVKNIIITPSGVNFKARITYGHLADRDKLKIIDIKQWGFLWKFSGCVSAFFGCKNLNITATDKVYFVGNCASMFYSCTSLTNVGDADTSQVTIMSDMFRSAIVFNQDISGWDTSNVRNMSNLFLSAHAFNQDISGWNTSKNTSLSYSFYQCYNFNQDLSNWDTSQVTIAPLALAYTSFDGNISTWDVSGITNFDGFLKNVTLSTANYDALLVGWESQNVQNNVSFHGGNSKYTLGGAAEAARQRLITDHNWTIIDGGGI